MADAAEHESLESRYTLESVEMSGDEIMPWDCQAGESGMQYAKFRVYLEMEREDRSTRKARKLWLAKHPELETTPGENLADFQRIATAHRWVARVLAYDRYADAKILEALTNRRIQTLAEIADFGKSLRKKAADMLASIKTLVKVEVIDPETKEVTYELRPTLSIAEIAKVASIGMEMEQLAIGAPTSRAALVGAGDDSTLNAQVNAKERFTTALEQVRQRRLSIGEHAAKIDAKNAVEIVEGDDVLGPDVDYSVEIDDISPSPDDIRRARLGLVTDATTARDDTSRKD